MEQIGWTVIESQFDSSQLHHKETLFTIGNGYLGTRGTFEEGYPESNPATFIHGVYDAVPVVQTELANCPDWLSLTIVVEGDRFSLDRGEILGYQRQLDMRWGIVSRDVLWRSPSGRKVYFHFERLASMADEHVLVVRCQVTPMDFDGEIQVETYLNPEAHTQGVKHWECLQQDGSDGRIWLHLRCLSSSVELGMAADLRCSESTLR